MYLDTLIVYVLKVHTNDTLFVSCACTRMLCGWILHIWHSCDSLISFVHLVDERVLVVFVLVDPCFVDSDSGYVHYVSL